MRLIGVVLLIGLLSLPLKASDPIVGTWVLDVKKSTFHPGPPPRSQTRVYRESAEGIIATVVTLGDDGRSTTVEYPVNYDGQTHPVTGSSEIDQIEMKRVSPARAESTLLHAGRVIATVVREVTGSNTLVITSEGLGDNGTPVRNVSVYTRK